MKLKQLFAITAIASALVLTGCKEEKKAEEQHQLPERRRDEDDCRSHHVRLIDGDRDGRS